MNLIAVSLKNSLLFVKSIQNKQKKVIALKMLREKKLATFLVLNPRSRILFDCGKFVSILTVFNFCDISICNIIFFYAFLNYKIELELRRTRLTKLNLNSKCFTIDRPCSFILFHPVIQNLASMIIELLNTNEVFFLLYSV